MRALLDAKSIANLRVGSGIYVASLLDRLGIAEAIKSKVTRPESDIVSELVAKGEVELGMVVITQILTTPGVDLVGPLPPEIQSYVVFTAGVSASSKGPDAAMDLIKFLTGPIATPVIKAQGMEPDACSLTPRISRVVRSSLDPVDPATLFPWNECSEHPAGAVP